jgi:hypothetical protein
MTATETEHPPSEAASPAPPTTLVGKIMAISGVLISLLFLSNLTFGGFIPLEIPDALPIIGNLDEVFFTGVLLTSLGYLGIPLIPNFRAHGTPLRIDGPKR